MACLLSENVLPMAVKKQLVSITKRKVYHRTLMELVGWLGFNGTFNTI